MKLMHSRIMIALLSILAVHVCLPVSVSGEDVSEKKKEELRRKIEELRSKKMQVDQQTQKKISESKGTGQKRAQSLEEIIGRYERLNGNCTGKKSQRCADIIYTLSKLYYDKSRDDYIRERAEYEKKMDSWEKNPVGAEPANPLPDYSKTLRYYQESVKEYPDFEKADEGWYQIGTIQTLNGNMDASRDAFAQIVLKFPNSPRASAAHFRLSEFCFLERDFTAALKHIEKIKQEEIYPEVRQMAHYRKAEIYYNRAEFDVSAQLFYEYVEKCDRGEYPKKDLRDEALEYLAISFSDMPDGARKAIAHFRKVGNRSYEAYVIYTVGMKNFNHGQYTEAILALETALKSYPFYEEAPVAQQMVVACFIIGKKYDDANAAREKLVDYYGPGSEWASRTAGNAVAVERASSEVRRALAAIPVYYHAEAQKKKNKELYEKALKRYEQYITTFPDEKWKVYEFKYNVAEIFNALRSYAKAAEYYNYVASRDLSTYPEFKMELDTLGMEQEEVERIRRQKKKKSPVAISQEDAGYNAIVAFDNLRKQTIAQKSLNDEQAYALPVTKKFIEYIHMFQDRFPESSNSPEVLYLAGNVHYSAKAHDAAIVEFKKILAGYASTAFGPKALRMLANTYSAAGEYEMALSKYRDLLTREKPNTSGYKEVLDLAAGAVFKKANALKESGNLIGAAEGFKQIFSEFPTSKIADRGWFEAGVSYEEAKSLELAAVTFKELGEKFPKSELREKSYVRSAEDYKKLEQWEQAAMVYELAAMKIPKADYAIPSLSAAADNYKKIKEYAKSGRMFDLIIQKYPTDKRTPLAIYNGGLVYEKGRIYEKAIGLYKLLGDKYTESEYAPEAYYSIGFCYEKMGNNIKMAQSFTSYAVKFTGNRSKQVSALVRAAEAYMKMKDVAETRKNCNTAVTLFEKFGKKTAIDPVAVSKAYFMLGQLAQSDFDKLSIMGKNEKEVTAKLKEKTKALEPVLKAYAKVIKLGVGEWTIRSTYMIGKSFVDFATAFRNQSLFGSRDQKLASKIKIISGLEKYLVKAMEKFEWNIQTSYDQNLENEWVDKSRQEYMRLAFQKGKLFEEIGELFKNAPIPKGFSPEEEQAYRDVLEEKYLEALDASLPKYEEGIRAAAALGVTGIAWTDSIKARIEFINPESEALSVQIQKRPPKASTGTAGAVPAAGTSAGGADQELQRRLGRIRNIVAMDIATERKVEQLRSMKNDARREIRQEEERIEEAKSQLGTN